MKGGEEEITIRHEEIHGKMNELMEQTRKDFEDEILSEKFTDIYLSQHQINNSFQLLNEKLVIKEKPSFIFEKKNQFFKLVQDLKSTYENKEKLSVNKLKKNLKDLNENHENLMKRIEDQRKEIDKNFKEELKILSKSYS